MTGRSMTERILDAYLAPEADRLPDRVMDAALDQIARTPQRRAMRVPWRFTTMTNSLRAATAIAIVAVVGAGALMFLNRGADVGQPTAAPTASVASSATLAPALPAGRIEPGRYRYDAVGIRVTLEAPAGWVSVAAASLGKLPFELPDGVNLGFAQPTTVFGDPCAPADSFQTLGPTVDDLVTALASLRNVTGQTQLGATISGFQGTHLSFVVDTEGIDCVMGLYGQGSFIRAAENGQRQDLWIVDVDGTRLVIDGATFPETSAADRAEMIGIVNTLEIEPID